MSFNFDFDSARKIETANHQTKYDLRYSAKTNKFNVSQRAYDEYDINNKGFNLIVDGNENVALTIVENAKATIHKGKSSADNKGRVFKADALKNALGLGEEDAHFSLEGMEHDGTMYYTLQPIGEDKENTSITSDESEEETAEQAVGQEDDLVGDEMETEDPSGYGSGF